MYDILNPVHYVAANNPEGVNEVLRKYNLAVDNDDEIFEACDILTEEYGEKAVDEIMQCHPDKAALRHSSVASLREHYDTLPLKDRNTLGDIPQRENGNGNGNGNGTNLQDRWMLIALLLFAAFALGAWMGKSK